ncbi:hypothetical protein RO3G_04991 [Rhizopus delemar RA 99-880]|uniref:Major facilitator superfamily (MFS) profile domain-containing protein n=1 Tax=Rhizopus delemar (strain RA 99-880 / ATCC MYA-4621 / FGSC 9543 / NRRL 43880) TaxID=246409 RepID=I1BVQ6_RHIO9|nr:hypothetical protein RO3G_04991 [Rhizopus delemar RA 99-880]|eukprot:EIE80286.1 hypothetical protein RO3G_04991 [Rhizopus delemar RA 99-880]
MVTMEKNGVTEHNEVADEERSTGNESGGYSSSSYVAPSPSESRALLWKLDLRIIPLIGALYLCSFLDRVNIGNARLAGLTTDLNISPNAYNAALSIFFAGYVLFEVPSNMILKVVGPSKWIPIVMLSWGITEAGLFPGIIFYLSLWYTRGEQATRVALFFSCSTLAGAFGGVLAYGIMQMDGVGGLHGWQWIFIIEAIPTLLLAFAAYALLPDFPENSKFINDREREVVIHRLKKDAGPANQTHFSWKQFRSAFTDYKVYYHALIFLCGCIPLYSLSLFMPSIIEGMGFTELNAQAMTAPPYGLACILTILVSMHADKKRERGLHVAVPAAFSAIGYALLIILRERGAVAMYIAAFIAAAGVFAQIPPMVTWLTSNIGGHTKRGVASAFLVSVGNIGGAIAGQIYRSNDAPLRNNLTPEEYSTEAYGEELCDLHPGFRYLS